MFVHLGLLFLSLCQLLKQVEVSGLAGPFFYGMIGKYPTTFKRALTIYVINGNFSWSRGASPLHAGPCFPRIFLLLEQLLLALNLNCSSSFPFPSLIICYIYYSFWCLCEDHLYELHFFSPCVGILDNGWWLVSLELHQYSFRLKYWIISFFCHYLSCNRRDVESCLLTLFFAD